VLGVVKGWDTPKGKQMAVYVIGDVQGCFKTLESLLGEIGFDPQCDQIILAGDLVNRGPDSVGVARWVLEQGEAVSAVLGNHDIHLLALLCGAQRSGRQDTLEALCAWSDRDVFSSWLLNQKFIREHGGWVVVHAGLLPSWSLEDAHGFSDELMSLLRGPGAKDFLKGYRRRGGDSETWETDLARYRFLLSVFTRMRICDEQGRPQMDFSAGLDEIPPGYRPWFEYERRLGERPIVFGHWASLGFFQRMGVTGLDSGCVWGNGLTALRLDDAQVFKVPTAKGDGILMS